MRTWTVYYGDNADYTFGNLDWANGYIDEMIRDYPESYKVKEGFSIGILN